MVLVRGSDAGCNDGGPGAFGCPLPAVAVVTTAIVAAIVVVARALRRSNTSGMFRLQMRSVSGMRGMARLVLVVLVQC